MHCCSRPLGGCFWLATCWPLAVQLQRHLGPPHASIAIAIAADQSNLQRTHPFASSFLHRLPTAFLPPLPVLPPVPPSPAPAAGHVPRAQRSVPERTPPLLARDSGGLGAAPEEGPRGLNTHPPELAPSLDSRQLGLRSKASTGNDVVNQKGPSMSQSLGHDACFFGPRLAPSLIAS